jgi:sugar phosphate isomerase/epimerase
VKLRLGVAGGPVPRDPAEVDAALARQLGELGVQVLVTHFQPDPRAVASRAVGVHDVLADHGLSIVQATGYNPQLTHPDDSILAIELDRLRAAFDTARLLGAEMVISGCGSRHPTAFYGPHPENHLATTRERLISSLRRVVPVARDAGVVLALECHVTTALDTPEHIREVIRAFGDVWANGGAIRHMWETLGGCYTSSAHVKDVRADPELVVHISEVSPGEGMLDFDAFFEVVRHLGENTAVIVEHLPADRALPAIAFVKREAEERGFTLTR